MLFSLEVGHLQLILFLFVLALPLYCILNESLPILGLRRIRYNLSKKFIFLLSFLTMYYLLFFITNYFIMY